MTNPLIKKVPNAHAGYLILICLGAGMLILWACNNNVNEQPITASTNIESRTVQAAKTVVQAAPRTSGKILKITAFSTGECHTVYCKSQLGKPRQYVAAVNKKLGRPSKIYIPAYDRFYQVIGTTDTHTDVDIFMGDDYQEAVNFGSKNLLVNLIK